MQVFLMKFYNREQELKLLENISKNKGFKFVVIYGRRRIGKTRLVREFLKDKDPVYIFVPRYKTKEIFLEEVARDLGIPRFSTVYDLIKFLFETRKYVFFDEFQNFYYMDKGIYSDFQQLIDEYKSKEKDINVFISGSSFSLMKKIFVDYTHPLYGRADILLKLPPFDLKTVWTILQDKNIENKEKLIRYYAVFGGIPKYYEFLEMPEASSFFELAGTLFFNNRMPLLKEEGRTVLVSEFGGEYRTYFSILEAIAGGRNTVAEIADVFGGKNNTVSRYLDILRKDYELVVRKTPIIDDPRRSKSGIYSIKDPFLKFWFAYVKRYESYYEQDRTDELVRLFNETFDSFVGFAFEDMVKGFLEEKTYLLPVTFDKIGRQWGRIKGAPKGKNTYEIDIAALNEVTKEILFLECKWKDLNEKDANKILADLQKKSGFVQWNNDVRNDYFGLTAKKVKGKEQLRKKGFVVFDLDDM
jgi:AAA+ ATPase superfamily predicted ATPase